MMRADAYLTEERLSGLKKQIAHLRNMIDSREEVQDSLLGRARKGLTDVLSVHYDRAVPQSILSWGKLVHQQVRIAEMALNNAVHQEEDNLPKTVKAKKCARNLARKIEIKIQLVGKHLMGKD